MQIAISNPRNLLRKQYKFDKVFGPDSTQEQVYEDTKALIRSVLDGGWIAAAPQDMAGECLAARCCMRPLCWMVGEHWLLCRGSSDICWGSSPQVPHQTCVRCLL